MTKEWLLAIGRSPFICITNECICSEHFKNKDFEEYGARKRLKPNVVPTLNMPLLIPSEELTQVSFSSDTESENLPPNQQYVFNYYTYVNFFYVRSIQGINLDLLKYQG